MTPKRSFPKFWKCKIWLDQINSFHGLFYEKAILVSFLFFACFWPFLSFLPKSDRERVHLYSILFKLKKDKERAHPNNGLGSNCFTALAQDRTSAMSLNKCKCWSHDNWDYWEAGLSKSRTMSCQQDLVASTMKASIFYKRTNVMILSFIEAQKSDVC